MIEEECGVYCGKVQTVMLRLPGKEAVAPEGWAVQAKLSLYLWLGAVQNKQFSYSGLPKGFELSSEIRNAERPGALAPSNIHYLEKHVSFIRPRSYVHIDYRSIEIHRYSSSVPISIKLDL